MVIDNVIKKVDLTEFNKLKKLLDDNDIPFEVNYFNETGTHQIVYPAYGPERKSDVVISPFSYGGNSGLLEQMGLLPERMEEEVQGWLDADTVFERWKKDYLVNP